MMQETVAKQLDGINTPLKLKTNIAPKNQWLEDVFPIKIVPFEGTIFLASRL